MNYYISDTHFGHANVMRYDNRLNHNGRHFNDVKEMDAELIKNWNSVVTNNDTVFILGDFSWYKEEKTLQILDMLNGKKVLIKGNHDRVSPKIARKFEKICDYLEVRDSGYKVVLSHYPMPFWNGQFRGAIHLYGHVHNSHQWNYCENIRAELHELQDIPMNMINVGCMMPYMKFTPKTLIQILGTQSTP